MAPLHRYIRRVILRIHSQVQRMKARFRTRTNVCIFTDNIPQPTINATLSCMHAYEYSATSRRRPHYEGPNSHKHGRAAALPFHFATNGKFALVSRG